MKRKLALSVLALGLLLAAAVPFRYRVVNCSMTTCVRIDRWTGRAERVRVAAPRVDEAEREQIRAFRERWDLPQETADTAAP
jgi:hypothetical protein